MDLCIEPLCDMSRNSPIRVFRHVYVARLSELLSGHSHKQVSEVYTDAHTNKFHIIEIRWSRAAVLRRGVVTEPGNIPAHLYSIFAVRTSQRYDPASWSSSAPVMKRCHTGYMWGQGRLNSSDLKPPTCSVCVCSVERCQRVGFFNPIVPFHCVHVFVWGTSAPHDIFPKRSSIISKLRDRVWSSLNNKYPLTV